MTPLSRLCRASAALVCLGFIGATSARAFDLNPFPDRVRELKTWISPETGPEATVEALLSVAPYFKIQKARAKEMVAHVEHVVAGWRDEGRSIGMTDAELEPFAPAFEHSEREAARGA